VAGAAIQPASVTTARSHRRFGMPAVYAASGGSGRTMGR
jgi:hypothetical protein